MQRKEQNVGYFFGEPVYEGINKRKPQEFSKDAGRDFAVSKIKKSGLIYESKFNDSFFIIKGIKGTTEFYPGTGFFTCKSTEYRGKGVDTLIKYAKIGLINF
jgi:hypothetical protein